MVRLAVLEHSQATVQGVLNRGSQLVGLQGLLTLSSAEEGLGVIVFC